MTKMQFEFPPIPGASTNVPVDLEQFLSPSPLSAVAHGTDDKAPRKKLCDHMMNEHTTHESQLPAMTPQLQLQFKGIEYPPPSSPSPLSEVAHGAVDAKTAIKKLDDHMMNEHTAQESQLPTMTVPTDLDRGMSPSHLSDVAHGASQPPIYLDRDLPYFSLLNISHGASSASFDDFYLVAHETLDCHTANAARYIVVVDDFKKGRSDAERQASVDKLKNFANAMCSMYYNWHGPIRVPVVIKLADRTRTGAGPMFVGMITTLPSLPFVAAHVSWFYGYRQLFRMPHKVQLTLIFTVWMPLAAFAASLTQSNDKTTTKKLDDHMMNEHTAQESQLPMMPQLQLQFKGIETPRPSSLPRISISSLRSFASEDDEVISQRRVSKTPRWSVSGDSGSELRLRAPSATDGQIPHALALMELLVDNETNQVPLGDVFERARSPSISEVPPTRPPTEADGALNIEREVASTPTGMLDRNSTDTPNVGTLDFTALSGTLADRADAIGAITPVERAAVGNCGEGSVIYPIAPVMRRVSGPLASFENFSGPSRPEKKRLSVTSVSALTPVLETDNENSSDRSQDETADAGVSLTKGFTQGKAPEKYEAPIT